MTNALTATKTPQLSSQGVPDVILVLNKQENYEKKMNEEKRKKRSARTSKGTAHAHAHTHAKAHAQAKRHMQLHKIDSISLSKKWNSETKGYVKSRKTNGARASRQ